MANAYTLRKEIDDLSIMLIKLGVGLAYNATVVEQVSSNRFIITWKPQNKYSYKRIKDIYSTIEEYKLLLNDNNYTIILFDGSIIQVTYVIETNEIVEHRLAYYPCPFYFEEEEIFTKGIIDIIEEYSQDEIYDNIRLRSPIRFDYNISSIDDHPKSHLHINDKNCRIPVYAPLSVGHFLNIIFKYFYKHQWIEYDAIRTLRIHNYGNTVNEDEKRLLYLNCNH